MKATVVRPSELSAAELDRWRGIQRANPTLRNSFPSPDFSLAIDRARPTARVAVLEDGGQIVGFFPRELQGRCIGKPIGANISDCQGFIHTTNFYWDVMQLVRACRLPVWEFDHLIAG
jgi:CelD/BcsL family acetyltransferase involved in cellulose biosynthesis